MEAIFSQNNPQNRALETSIRHKNSEKGPTFSSKIPERVDIETLWWHTPVRKYHEFPPGTKLSPRGGVFVYFLPQGRNFAKIFFPGAGNLGCWCLELTDALDLEKHPDVCMVNDVVFFLTYF